jgi:hypothetical protein
MNQWIAGLATGCLLLSAEYATADSIPFSCNSAGSDLRYAVYADLQRQSVILSGLIGVNCCASRTFSSELSNGLLDVVIDNQAGCECVDQPCAFSFSVTFGNRLVSRVTVKSNFGDVLLDTVFSSVRVSAKPLNSAVKAVISDAAVYDLRGMMVRPNVSNLRGNVRPLPQGVYLVCDHGRFSATFHR